MGKPDEEPLWAACGFKSAGPRRVTRYRLGNMPNTSDPPNVELKYDDGVLHMTIEARAEMVVAWPVTHECGNLRYSFAEPTLVIADNGNALVARCPNCWQLFMQLL